MRHVFAVTLIFHCWLYWVSYKSCGSVQNFVLTQIDLHEREQFREELLRLYGYPGMTVDSDGWIPNLMPQWMIVFPVVGLLSALTITRESSSRQYFLQANIVQAEGQHVGGYGRLSTGDMNS